MLRTIVVTVAVLAASASLAACGTGAGSGSTGVVATPGPTPAVAPAAAPRTVVMVIRHGEKPDGEAPGLDAAGNEDDSSLTEVGWTRANRLVDLFDPVEGPPAAGLARPDAIYAAGANNEGEGQRTRETVAPLGDRLGIPVNTDFGRGDEKTLVDRVADEPGTTLISWQHGGITEIADAFPKAKPKPPSDWPEDRFDIVWTFTRTADGWRFAQVPERLLPGDSGDIIEK